MEVSFNLSSREYNGRYFHNVDAWRIENQGKQNTEMDAAPEFNAPATEEDYLNQLLMASLMKGRKPTYGRQAPSSYGVGTTVPFGDAWKMRRTIGGQ